MSRLVYLIIVTKSERGGQGGARKVEVISSRAALIRTNHTTEVSDGAARRPPRLRSALAWSGPLAPSRFVATFTAITFSPYHGHG